MCGRRDRMQTQTRTQMNAPDDLGQSGEQSRGGKASAVGAAGRSEIRKVSLDPILTPCTQSTLKCKNLDLLGKVV